MAELNNPFANASEFGGGRSERFSFPTGPQTAGTPNTSGPAVPASVASGNQAATTTGGQPVINVNVSPQSAPPGEGVGPPPGAPNETPSAPPAAPAPTPPIVDTRPPDQRNQPVDNSVGYDPFEGKRPGDVFDLTGPLDPGRFNINDPGDLAKLKFLQVVTDAVNAGDAERLKELFSHEGTEFGVFQDLSDPFVGNLAAQAFPKVMPSRFQGAVGAQVLHRVQKELAGLAPGEPTAEERAANPHIYGSGADAASNPHGLSPAGQRALATASTSTQNEINQILSGSVGGPGNAGGSLANALRSTVKDLLDKGPELDYDRVVGDMKNVREQFIPIRERARRRAVQDAVQRGFDPNDEVTLATLAEVDAKVETAISQSFRDIATAELENASNRFMHALDTGTALLQSDRDFTIEQGRLAVSRSALALEEKLGLGRLSLDHGRLALDSNVAENQILLQNLALSQEWQKFSAQHGLSLAEFEFAQQNAADGNTALLISQLLQFLGIGAGGFTTENQG